MGLNRKTVDRNSDSVSFNSNSHAVPLLEPNDNRSMICDAKCIEKLLKPCAFSVAEARHPGEILIAPPCSGWKSGGSRPAGLHTWGTRSFTAAHQPSYHDVLLNVPLRLICKTLVLTEFQQTESSSESASIH
jgi:hypothetical protein